MSYSDFLRRKATNSPVVTDRQMRFPDASSFTWRQKLLSSRVQNPTDHVINNVNDPSTTPIRNKKVMSYLGSGYGGKVRDASQFTLSSASTAIGRDNFSNVKLVQGLEVCCYSRPPASQVVDERGNSDRNIAGLNMGYTAQRNANGDFTRNAVGVCTGEFNPLTKTYFVDRIPELKNQHIGTGPGIDTRDGIAYSQNPIRCPTSTTGVPKGQIKHESAFPTYSQRPVFTDRVTAPIGPQVGGGLRPGSRAPKTGSFVTTRFSKPNMNKAHGFAGFSQYNPIPYVPQKQAVPSRRRL